MEAVAIFVIPALLQELAIPAMPTLNPGRVVEQV